MNRTLALTASLAAAAFHLSLAAAPGCGSNNPVSAPGGASGLGGIGAGGTGGDGCSAIANVGQTVTQVQRTSNPPTPAGGAIADGTYVLTSDEAYPPVVVSDPPAFKRVTLQIAGTTMDAAIVNDVIPDGFTGRATITTAGVQATITWLCGASGTFTQTYTATPTGLMLISPPGDVETYTKQ